MDNKTSYADLHKFEHFIESDDIVNVLKVIDSLDNVGLADFLIAAKYDVRHKFISKYLSHNIYVITELPLDIREMIVDVLGIKEFTNHIKYLQTDDILDAIEGFNDSLISEILEFLPKKVSEVLKEVLSYPEESAGRLIHKDFILIPENWTVGQAIDLLRTYKDIPDTLHELFVVDNAMKPQGSVRLSMVICSKRQTMLAEIMDKDLKMINPSMDQEAVARLFQKYYLLSALVVNSHNNIVGVITVEDILEVVKQEADEDIFHLAKVSETDINAKVAITVKRRIKWLVITFVSINCSSFIIGIFENTLKESVELVILMPVVAAMAGNAGIQASTIAVRAITSKQLNHFNATRLFFKELLVGFVNGTIIAVLMILVILFRFHNVKLEVTFILTIIAVFSLATSFGASVPLIVDKLKGDPALCSSIITSSFTDTISFFVLLTIATWILL